MTTRKAVLWDVDGTLIDSEPLHSRALRETSKSFGVELPDNFHDTVVGRSGFDVYEIITNKLHFKAPYDEWIARKYQYYLENKHQLSPRPGAREIFQTLEDKGIQQAIVSNSDRVIVNVNLNVLGITRAGLRSVSRNDVLKGKPDPESYLRAAWLLCARPQNVIVVEDSVIGAKAGLAAGMTTLFWPEQNLHLPEENGSSENEGRTAQWLQDNGLDGATMIGGANQLLDCISYHLNKDG